MTISLNKNRNRKAARKVTHTVYFKISPLFNNNNINITLYNCLFMKCACR